MSISNKLIGITPTAGGVGPVGIDFDGTNDYLSRSTDLVGNADGKTFTFSAWVWNVEPSSSTDNYLYSSGLTSGGGLFIYLDTNVENLRIDANDPSVSQFLRASVTNAAPVETWTHILISIDLSSPSNRSVYINDEPASVTWTSYPNADIDFTNSGHAVGALSDASKKMTGRLAGVYLDYTYRDLSVEANRRDFIDADGRYVTPPTSGIISVPMDDPEDPGRNDGTGGDFTLNGTIAQAGRGPNQYNAAASTFDGSADYLSRAYTTSSTKTITFSVIFKKGATNEYISSIDPGSNTKFQIYARTTGLEVRGWNSSNTSILQMQSDTTPLVVGKYYCAQVTFDLSDSSKRQMVINGLSQSLSVTTYTNDNLDLQGTFNFGALNGGAIPFNGELSDFWWDESYTADLTGFYDTETGKPKDLGVDGSNPTGSAPLIYLPLRADDAGSNKGTGGDFTVNSGPYVGARGPSEFWGESADFEDTSSQYLTNTGLIGVSDSKTVTMALAVLRESSPTVTYQYAHENSDFVFSIISNVLNISAKNASNTTILSFGGSTSLSTTAQWYTFLLSVDMSDSAKRHVYVDGISDGGSFSTYTNAAIKLTDRANVGAITSSGSPSGWHDGKIGFLWFNTEYIDFSQEANRLKFFDAFNYPVDLGEDGSLPTGNQPLIYMNNDFHLGTNLGSGGDFTPVNTPTDGGFVKG